MTTAATLSAEKPTFAALIKAGALGGLVAAAINGALYFITKASGVAYTGLFRPEDGVGDLPAVAPFVSSFLPGLVGALLLFLLSRFTAKAGAIFVGIAGLFTLVSCYGPMNIPEASMATRAMLTLMHFTAAAPITYFLLRALKR